ncbi:hypothetical protein AURDEDRAFT_142524 [Auricularia subglabra TFB-10046 SS5]|nr:hypothetical protein AURDEDRAFT_142524 [Auricularia subglabra TFB-10046 SS5]
MAAAPSPQRSATGSARSSPAQRDRDDSPTRSGHDAESSSLRYSPSAHDSGLAYSPSLSRTRKRMAEPDAYYDSEPRKKHREDNSWTPGPSAHGQNWRRPYAFATDYLYPTEPRRTDGPVRELRDHARSRSPDRRVDASYGPTYTRQSPPYILERRSSYDDQVDPSWHQHDAPQSWAHNSIDDSSRIYRYGGADRDSARDQPHVQAAQPVRKEFTPEASPTPTAPSADYLLAVDIPSVFVEHPTARKLLILDLNGTLLFRSKATHPSKPRRVLLRPYVPAFLQYLFFRDTNYDLMVWSSAQPVNVKDMVEKVFGGTRKQLVAVWDRKYFNLSQKDYYKKSITLKNLEKPWNFLNAARAEGKQHSAATTLLLDDSTVKASLQPYNHLCVTEFDETAAKHERLLLELEQMRVRSQIPRPDENEKKKQKRLRRAEAAERAVLDENGEPRGHEDMLLAVIGVLDHIRHETNVANWIKNGGLWAVGPPGHAAAATPQPASAPSALPDTDEIVSPQPDSIASTPRQSSPAPLPPSSSQIIEVSEVAKDMPDAGSIPAAASSLPDLEEDHAQPAAEVAESRAPVEPIGNDREVDPLSLSDLQAPQPMWFEHKENYQHWVAAGRAALQKLAIHVPVAASTTTYDDHDVDPE